MWRYGALFMAVILACGLPIQAYAALGLNGDLPASADPSRLRPNQQPLSVPQQETQIVPENEDGYFEVPEGIPDISVVFRRIEIKGITAFTKKQLAPLYAPYLNKQVKLAVAWKIAADITQFYRKAGYFLARAYVPAQEVDAGVLTIQVIEGYIGDVVIEGKTKPNRVAQTLIASLKASKPLKSDVLETVLLRLNDLPGEKWFGSLEPMDIKDESAVRLRLSHSRLRIGKDADAGTGAATLSNSGSRYLGPYQAGASYTFSPAALQKTTVSALSTVPTRELKYTEAQQQWFFAPEWNAEFSGSYVEAAPGFTLTPLDIESQSTNLKAKVNYQWLRQRRENLVLSLATDGQNTNSDIVNTPLTRDRIRAVRLGMTYDMRDSSDAYNAANITLSRGTKWLGANKKGQDFLSREEAVPNFSILEFELLRQQIFPNSDWLTTLRMNGQYSRDPLYSAEEFGVGGATVGRAYDTSEISGDRGLAGALEMAYLGISPMGSVKLEPYLYYDVGKIWNEDRNSTPQSAASAGGGLRVNHLDGWALKLGLAYPLTRPVADPLYGNPKSPRIMLELGKNF